MKVSKMLVGRILSGLVVIFLLLDGGMKVLRVSEAVKATIGLGYPVDVLPVLGVLILVIAVLFAIPRTAFLGAILLTGLLGGAVATHVRVSSPLFSHVLFGVYVGIIAWIALLLRDARLRALFRW